MTSDLEKMGAAPSEAIESPSPGSHHHHLHRPHLHARERLRQFMHPDGRKIYVADTPQHAVRMRLQMTEDDPYEVHIVGSPEHVDALRQTHSHHQRRHDEFRERHGDLFEQFSAVHGALDSLSIELDRVTEQGISMDAHFSRFGYDAHIRTFDDVDDSDDVSQPETPPASLRAKRRESSSEETMAEPLRLFNVPVVRQYFYKGVLWRASDNQEVQSFELFVDLLYVGIIGINGDTAADTADGLSLLHFIIVFTISWKIWNDIALLISWFKNEDLFQRLSILLLLALLFGLTTNLENAFSGTYPTIIGFYIAARVFMSFYLALVAWLVPMVRPIMMFYTVMSLLGVGVWISSIHVSWPYQLIPIWFGIFLDIAGPTIWIFGRAMLGWFTKEGVMKFDKHFEVTPAMNIEHRVERTGAFVTLIFGYTVFSILYQSTINGVDGFFGKGILGLMQCFFFNWIYFEFDNDNIMKHAIRRAKWSAFMFSMGHLPLIMSFVLSGGALSRLVVANDCHDTDLEDLTDVFQARSDSVVKPGIRWFYCGGLGMTLLFMCAVAAAHVHKENKLRFLRKRNRLLFRAAAGITIICLSMAEQLNSLELIGTVTAIVASVLIVELWAAMSTVDHLFKFSSRTRYVGMCPKKHFKQLAEGKVDLESDAKIIEDGKEGGLVLAPV